MQAADQEYQFASAPPTQQQAVQYVPNSQTSQQAVQPQVIQYVQNPQSMSQQPMYPQQMYVANQPYVLQQPTQQQPQAQPLQYAINPQFVSQQPMQPQQGQEKYLLAYLQNLHDSAGQVLPSQRLSGSMQTPASATATTTVSITKAKDTSKIHDMLTDSHCISVHCINVCYFYTCIP